MTVSAEARVRARLMALKAALETDHESGAAQPGSARLRGMQHQARSIGELANHTAALKRIDDALARVDGHKYGYCASCGVTIDDKRLEADPAIIHCAKCGGDQQ